MGFLAKFNLEGKTYNIISFRQGVHQSTDYTGKPEASPHAGIFTLTIESVNDDNLTAWAVTERMTKRGKVVFLRRDNPGTLYDYEFADAYCIEYEERYHHNTTWPMTTTLVISAGVVKTRGQIYERPWKVTNLGAVAEELVNSNDEPRVKDCFYSDLKGNKQPTVETGEEVYLVLETENMIGQTIDIDLSSHTKDFVMNDEIIKDDVIKDFAVTRNTHKLKLRVVVQQDGEFEEAKEA